MFTDVSVEDCQYPSGGLRRAANPPYLLETQGGIVPRKTSAAGNLKTDDKQVVKVEKEDIKIVPVNRQAIYVPQCNPTTVMVVGDYSSCGYWPMPNPVYYQPYPPGTAFIVGLIWGAAIGGARMSVFNPGKGWGQVAPLAAGHVPHVLRSRQP